MVTVLERTAGEPTGTRRALRRARARRLVTDVAAWVVEHAVAVAVVLTVVLRLPMLARAPRLDEAGFLMVAGQWRSGGSSLYGGYWVDRPPLLITIFRAAALSGGLVPLRLIGCLAAAMTVVGAAHVASRMAARERLGSRTAASVAAVAAAAWCVSPLTGSAEVDGELLAAPFVVWGIAAAWSAVSTAVAGSRRSWLYAAAAGMAGVAALTVKQNFADVWVFGGALVLGALLRRELSLPGVVRLGASFMGGALALAGVISAWTLAHGTSLGGAFYAMYPFRITAAQVIATSGNNATLMRLGQLALAWGVGGMAVVTVLVLGSMLRTRRASSTAALALALLVVFDALSILLGGGFWPHYLVQLVVPLSVLLGVAAARGLPGARLATTSVALTTAVAVVVSGALLPGVRATVGSALGHAVGDAARPGDTVVTLYGRSDVTRESGLSSPYPYLWSLPTKTLDPDLRDLDRVLSGPDAPTWVVVWVHVTSWGVRTDATSAILARRYHVAAVLHGHPVYLLNDVQRPAPAWPAGLGAS